MAETVVTRAELAFELYRRDYGSKAQSRDITDVVINAIADCLRLGKTVHLKGVGRFEVVPTAERLGRNPKTGEPHVIPAGRRIKFHPSKTLQRQLNAEAHP